MAFSDQAMLSNDGDFTLRVAACAAVEVELEPGGEQPFAWAVNNIWLVAAAPGFADKYASALAAGVPRPGNDQSVIADADITAAVQALIAPP